jgi:hypothetical protein
LEIAETLQGTGFRSAAKEDNGNDVSAEMTTSVTVQEIKLFVYLLLWRKLHTQLEKKLGFPKILKTFL